MNASEKQTNQNINSSFPVVGIGTSYAEIDNLKTSIANLPLDSGMAFLVFEDLAARQHQNLTEEISLHTKLPVHEIVSTIDLSPNHIYVIPPGNFLTWENGDLMLKPAIRSSKTTNSLDIFFYSLAQKYYSYAVGLLLSWSTMDGVSGLKTIREFGGATISAVTKSGFVLNKTTSDFIDYITSSEQTTSILLEINKSYLANHAYQEQEVTVEEQNIFNSIVNLVVLRSGTNFHNYKPQTLRRRIAKRMVFTKQETGEQYLNLLKNSPAEQDLLFNDFLIPVTYFFRDPQFYDSLSQIVFPSLIERLSDNELRIWSAGCSTGEEVYSLAIVLDEYLQKINNRNISVKIFASDLSLKCIEKARAGIYTLQDLKNIDAKRIEKYFIKRENGYHVKKAIRDNCVFAMHDLTKDFPFSRIDFISCRNVLIYFNTELQNQVLTSFHYALKENGFLFLGKAESAYSQQNLFTAVEEKEKIYIRKNVESDLVIPNLIKDINFLRNQTAEPITPLLAKKDFRKIISDILLESYSPAAVLINEDLEIVYFHGDTSPFLQPPPGKPSFNIMNMAPQELRFSLRNAILRARNEKKNFAADNIKIKSQAFLVSFEVVYLAAHTDLLMIIFYRKSGKGETFNGVDIDPNNEELIMLQNDFKQLSEEQQIYFEELQTSNEELSRRTEELQLLNEQLEVAAEELRSNNEELSFTNEELNDRRKELASMRNFYESIVKTIKEPLLIIDKNFIVHSANPAFYSYFEMQEEHTEEFSIFDLGNSNWNTAEFKESVLKKISRNETVDNIKIQFNESGGKEKTMLVSTAFIEESIPKGMVLLAFEDITESEEYNKSLRAKNIQLSKQSQQLKSFTAAASHNLLDPVSKISMFAKKIIDSENNLSEVGRYNINRLLSAAKNLNLLMEDLINYSKINFEEKKFKKTDLNVLLKKALNTLKPMIKERNAVIEADLLPTLNVIPYQIHMLFIHLISNAIKYAKQDSHPQIKVNVHQLELEDFDLLDANSHTEYVKLSVSDNGMGFQKDFETLIFNPFYKLQGNNIQYGTGLGLTFVQQIVWNHKGFIRASSLPGVGTSIYVYLPLEISYAEKLVV
ncbi:CheR family methyltransferase [Flavobacterium sp.]|uniref:CheR family methyltransferase n=1 Tax=Flavobacterium sp. TaxID=239 RepID=UPI002BDAB4F4|nr:CheR family methyltransferase [Flavobacterium sp.]HSD06239.1 CheR family methyltransferase [Flavobacterium sp.]